MKVPCTENWCPKVILKFKTYVPFLVFHTHFTVFSSTCLQEHTVLFITWLLSPSVPSDYSGSDSHLISYAPFLNVLIVGISSVDCIQILSLHGLVGNSSAVLFLFWIMFSAIHMLVSVKITLAQIRYWHIVALLISPIDRCAEAVCPLCTISTFFVGFTND